MDFALISKHHNSYFLFVYMPNEEEYFTYIQGYIQLVVNIACLFILILKRLALWYMPKNLLISNPFLMFEVNVSNQKCAY